MHFQLINDTQNNRFKFNIKNSTAHIEYILVADRIYLLQTEISNDIQRQGVGSILVKESLEFIKKMGYQLNVTCPFILGYIDKYPEWKKLEEKTIS